uniref:Niban 1/2/3 domain-containing protein n=1 Tax=Monopterus albus TaxID=43700 RepID=A0A3Q3K2J2_MONAL
MNISPLCVCAGQAEAELRDFSPYYRKQVSVARCSQVEDELEQHKEKITQLLKHKVRPECHFEVLYEGEVLFFDDARKWRQRYMVVRANYSLEFHDSLVSFMKGVPPRYKLLPTGGTVLTAEDMYMAMVDKCFPDETNVKEDFAPPVSGMPGQFPVYLRLPYRRDYYFCFQRQNEQAAFISILSDCIRHQNQDFLKKTTYEVQAFLKAIQLYRQDKGQYEPWDMLTGSDVRVMSNQVMEQLLPSLQNELLPRLKSKKTERKRVWFATVEAAYILVQEHLLDGLSALKEECQIINCRRQLEEKIRAKVSEPAQKLCSEAVQPYLGSILDELMEPISSGFQEGRQLSEHMMNQLHQDVLEKRDDEQLKKALGNMARPNLLSCYQKVGSLQEKLQHLQEKFGFFNTTAVIHSAQLDLQQVRLPPHPRNNSSEQKSQYDYDSCTVRKRIFQEALVSITLPFIKKNLAPTCKTELQSLEQFIYAEYSNFIHVENVYEDILLQTLDKEVTTVVKEAASLKKHNLFTDSRDVTSLSSVSSPGKVTQSVVSQEQETPAPKAEEVIHTVEAGGTVALHTVASAGTAAATKTQEVGEAATPETVVQEEVISVQTAEVETAAELERPSTGALKEALSDTPTVVESIKTDAEAAAQTEAPVRACPDPTHETASTEDTGSQPAASSEDEVSTAFDMLEYDANISKSPVSELSPQAQMEALSGGVKEGASVSAEAIDTTTNLSSEPTSAAAQPLDCVKEIRDLVTEVIEVKEPAQRHPSEDPQEE